MDRIKHISPPDKAAYKAASERWDSIAKPLGSFGILEDAVKKLAISTNERVVRFDILLYLELFLRQTVSHLGKGLIYKGCNIYVTDLARYVAARCLGCLEELLSQCLEPFSLFLHDR